MAKSGLSSWLSAAEPTPAFAAAEATTAEEATDSPLDVGIAQLRGEGDAAITRISPDKRALVEDIDTEEDDAEFDERAHWGRRRARKKARAGAGCKSGNSDESQPSIALFCVATAAKEGSDDTKLAGNEVENAPAASTSEAADAAVADDGEQIAELAESSPARAAGADAQSLAEASSQVEDANTQEEKAEHPMHTPKRPRRQNRRQLRLHEQTPPAVNDLSVDSIVAASPGDANQSEQPGTNSSGRPKRQAAVRAEQMHQQGKSRAQVLSDEVVLFLTPPPRSRRQNANRSVPSPSSVLVIDDTPVSSEKKSAKKKAGTTEASPEVVLLATKAASNGGSRKRKLCLDKKKSPPGKAAKAGSGTPNGSKAAQAFFLTDQERKQLQEIEAVTSFREELRKAREKDLAFFMGSKGVNPFFQAHHASSSSSRSKKKSQVLSSGDDSSAIEVDDDVDTPDQSQKKGGKKWKKEAAVFPSVQHIVCADSAADMDVDVAYNMPPRRSKPAAAIGPEIVVLDDDDDNSQQTAPGVRRLADIVGSGNVQVDEEASLSDMFWFCEYRQGDEEADASDDETEYDDRWATHLEGPEDDFISYLVDTYGVREKRVRELLASLEAARDKRLNKEANLTLVDRYLPVMASGIVGNKETVHLLSSWLSAWKSGGNGRERSSCFQSELYAFKDDSEDEMGCDLHRLFILEGASGAGKSATVYACAEELGYQVIEINAAQNRSGKSIVEIAGEATQSTRVLHVADAGGKKKKKATPPKKRKASSSKRKSVDGAPASSHLSLVLFEDVDVVFDEDRGFLSSLCAIARRSKCPIVVTCAELPDNFPSTPSRLCGELSRPSRGEFSAWIMLVAHLEGVALAPALVETMARFFDCDIRHALHFLQTNLSQLVSPLPRNAQWQWRGDGLSLASLLEDSSHITSAAASGSTGSSSDVVEIEMEEEAQPPAPASSAVQAWTMYAGRSFDVLLSNLLPELRSATEKEDKARGSEEKTLVQKRADVELLSDLADVMDAASLADSWVARCHDDDDAFSVLTDGIVDGSDAASDDRKQQLLNRLAPEPTLSFFQQERVRSLARDVRRAALDALTDSGRPGERLLLGLPGENRPNVSPGRCVRRTRAAAMAQRDRDAKRLEVTEVMPKLELPLLSIGSARTGSNARFMLDYLPTVARLLSAGPALGVGRRRASRRNHYLKDVLADMSVADDLPRFTSYARLGGQEETVGASPLTSPMPS